MNELSIYFKFLINITCICINNQLCNQIINIISIDRTKSFYFQKDRVLCNRYMLILNNRNRQFTKLQHDTYTNDKILNPE